MATKTRRAPRVHHVNGSAAGPQLAARGATCGAQPPSITLGNVLNAIPSLNQLIEMKMPGVAAFAVRRLVRELQPLKEDHDAELEKLKLQYATLDESGEAVVVEGNLQFEPDKLAELNRAYGELLATPVEVTARLRMQGLEQLELEPRVLLGLGNLIEE